jgi:hypothetical protein
MKKLTILAAVFIAFIGISITDINAQSQEQDKEIRYNVRFAKGKTSSVLKRKIPLGTTHLYTLRAKKGQDIKVILTTGNKTSFTIYSPTDGIIEGADGETFWRGMINESGEYLIAIGTDKTANYTLEIYIK